MHSNFSKDKPAALPGLKTFFWTTVGRLPNEKYLEELASFLPNDFFSAHKTPAQRWGIIKHHCKNPSFKNVIYSDWRYSPVFIQRRAYHAQAPADLDNINIFNKLRRYNQLRHLLLPNATQNRMPLLKQQAIVLAAIDRFTHSAYSEENTTLDMEVDAHDDFTNENIRDYYYLHSNEIKKIAEGRCNDIFINHQPAPTSLINYYLKADEERNDESDHHDNPPVAHTSLVQWKCVVPIVCLVATTAMIAFYNHNKPA